MSQDPTPERRTLIKPTKDEETGERKCIKAFKPSAKQSTVERQDDGPTNITVPVSSTAEDRDGDEFSEEGLEVMVEQLSSGDVPMFLDHGLSPETMYPDYRVTEIRGKFTDAATTEDNLVMATVELREDDEKAEEVARMMEQDMPVGFSVGFIIEDYEEKENGGFIFTQVDMLETSAVGIPSNPDGVAQSAAAAAAAVKEVGRDRTLDPDDVERGVKAMLEDEDDTMLEEDQDADTGGEDVDENAEQSGEASEDKQDVEEVIELLEQVVSNQEDIMNLLEEEEEDEEEEPGGEVPDDEEEESADPDEQNEEGEGGQQESADPDEQEQQEEDNEGKDAGDTINTLDDEDTSNTESTLEVADPEEYGAVMERGH